MRPDWLQDVLTREAPREDGGIPRFTDDESYAASFGREWNWFATTQLDRLESGRRESEETFFLKTGWRPEQLEGKLVLDAGCGMGRFADVASRQGARVAAADISSAVDAAQANLGSREGVAVVQADLLDLPFKPGSFDLIYSIGVLHHTPDTREAFHRLVPLLRPGGELAIWVYSREGQLRGAHVLSDLYRRRTSRMDHERLLGICRRLEPLGRLYRTRLGRYLYPLLPVSSHPEREWRVLDTFDWYSPRYQWKHAWHEVEGWFREAGLAELRRNDFPIAVAGRRPG